jgi:hypothetical protein
MYPYPFSSLSGISLIVLDYLFNAPTGFLLSVSLSLTVFDHPVKKKRDFLVTHGGGRGREIAIFIANKINERATPRSMCLTALLQALPGR